MGICNRYAMVKNSNGEMVPSTLHKALLSDISNRAVANYIYASYLLPGISQAMDANPEYTKRKNKQGQHSAKDVLEFLGLKDIKYEITELSIKNIELRMGTRDSNDNVITFSTSIEALNKALEINNTYNTLSSVVLQLGKEYVVLTQPKDSRTHFNTTNVDAALLAWDRLKNIVNVDLDALQAQFPDILNASSLGLASYLLSIKLTDPNLLSLRELEFLITAYDLATGRGLISNLLSTLGADYMTAIFNDVRGNNSQYTGLIERALLFLLLYLSDVESINSTVGYVTSSSLEFGIKKTLQHLNKNYRININAISLIGERVSSLSLATAKAIVHLERKILALENRMGTVDERRNLLKLKDKLTQELETKRYYSGLVTYIADATTEITKIDDELQNLSQVGTPYENALEVARVITKFNDTVNGYRSLLTDLSNMDKLIIDEGINTSAKNQLMSMALTLLDLINKIEARNKSLVLDKMVDICEHILGKKYNDDYTIAQIVKMCPMETWGMDVFYSFGELSNPIGATMGDIIRNNLDRRSDEIRENVTYVVREATNKLYQAGYDSSFMFEDDTTIISPYDWKLYRKLYGILKFILEQSGLDEFEVLEAMEQWEENNTVDLVVDHKTGRTERVPNDNYLKKINPLDGLSTALREYYNTMMELKGLIGTLMPEELRKQYMPPLVRKDFLDALSEGWESAWETMKEKAKGEFVLLENDLDFAQTARTAEGEYAYARGDVSGREYREIPIFFARPLKSANKEESQVLHNFSAGILALGASAYNYNAMSEVRDVIEFMRYYINNTEHVALKGGKAKALVEQLPNTEVTLTVSERRSATVMLSIIDNLIDKQLYGINMKDNPTVAKVAKLATKYTSVKGLSTNWLGGVANLLVGEAQLWQMALGNALTKAFNKTTPFFSLTDFMVGFAKLWREPLRFTADITGVTKLARNMGIKAENSVWTDILDRNKDSKNWKLAEYFDLFNENYADATHLSYRKGLKRWLKGTLFFLYSAGEYAIRYHALFSLLNSRKILINGKKTTLIDLFENTPNQRLAHKPNVMADGIQLTDANGNLTADGKQYMDKFTRDLRHCALSMFGAMNEEDAGAIQMYAAGRVAMNFRRWMIKHYGSRYRGLHWDKDLKQMTRGYWSQTGKYIKDSLTNDETKLLLKDGKKFKAMGQMILDLVLAKTNFIHEWTKANDNEKLALMRSLSAVITWCITYGALLGLAGGGVVGLYGLLGDEDEERKKRKEMTPAQKFAFYLLKRLLFEEESSFAIGAVKNAETLIKSPLPAIRTFDNALYFLTGLTLKDYNKVVERGAHKGENLYLYRVKKYNLPFYRDYYRFQEFAENDALFGMFAPDRLQ